MSVVSRYILLIVWATALAGATVASWALVQTAATLVIRGMFIWDIAEGYFLWWEIEHPVLIVVALVEAIVVMAVVWPRPRPRTQSHTWLRIGLWTLSTAIAATCVLGLVRGGSGLSSMLHGDFELTRRSAMLWFVEIEDFDLLGIRVHVVPSLWLGVVLAGYLFLLYLGLAYRAHTRHSGRGAWTGVDPSPVDVSEVRRAADGYAVGEWQRDLFIDMLTDASRRVQRIGERISPNTRSTSIRSTYEIGLEGAPDSGDIVVPVFATSRGQLEDGLRVTRADDDPLVPLVSTTVTAYTLAVVRSGIRAAGARAFRAYRADGERLEGAIVRHLARTYSIASRPEAEQRADARAFAALLLAVLELPKRDEKPLYRVVLLLSALYQSYAVAVSVPAADLEQTVAGPRATIVVERRTTPSLVIASWETLLLDASNAWRRRGLLYALGRFSRFARGKLMDQIRLAFGVRSNRLAHSLGNATRTTSFHLEFAGPEHTYMARQAVENIAGWEDDLDLVERIRARASPAVGQRHSHLAIRDGERFLGRFRYSVAYFERTPGSMAIAFVAAASALLIAVIVALRETALLESALLDDGGAVDDSAASLAVFQILFAFPIVGAASGALRPDRSQWGGVLSARVANLITILVSLVALWVSFLGFGISEEARPRVWLLIIFFLGIVAVACLGSWLMRLAVHARFIDPFHDDELEGVAGVLAAPVPGRFSRWLARRGRQRITTTRRARRWRRRAVKLRTRSIAMQSALAEVRLGPSVWVVPELWESRPWALPQSFLRVTPLGPDEQKVAINLGVITIDAVAPENRTRVADSLSVTAHAGTAASLMRKVIAAIDAAVEHPGPK